MLCRYAMIIPWDGAAPCFKQYVRQRWQPHCTSAASPGENQRTRERERICDRCRGVKRNAKDEMRCNFICIGPLTLCTFLISSPGVIVWLVSGLITAHCVLCMNTPPSQERPKTGRTAGVVVCMCADFSCACNKMLENTCALGRLCVTLI